MLDLTWKLFSETGSIETYLLMKELEGENVEEGDTDVSFDSFQGPQM
ncbi:YqzL family protein [Aciduricibacillus chroicocephali]|uniref:YqzL family protein n=1 Tax=Aciduricibacillus chroicocephali TaxID=3054939 RepID=A0ABY9KS63_9BACI|nr:YqzL family protein [Bacillaceae bacterium 44XB]